MKISKNKAKQIIVEELRTILTEQDDDTPGSTRVVPRAQLKKDAEASAKAKGKDPLSAMDTQEIDIDAIIQQQMDSMREPALYRKEARRLFDVFFGGRNEYGMERLVHNDDALEEIVEKLVGWMFPQTFKGSAQPSPMFVKVAQEFEKEGIPIIANEDHFLDRVEEKVLAIARKGFADTGAGSEEDVAAVDKQIQGQRKEAAKSWATDQVIKVLNDEDPRFQRSPLPTLDKATTDEIDQLVRLIPLEKPELYKQAYDFYMKKTS